MAEPEQPHVDPMTFAIERLEASVRQSDDYPTVPASVPSPRDRRTTTLPRWTISVFLMLTLSTIGALVAGEARARYANEKIDTLTVAAEQGNALAACRAGRAAALADAQVQYDLVSATVNDAADTVETAFRALVLLLARPDLEPSPESVDAAVGAWIAAGDTRDAAAAQRRDAGVLLEQAAERRSAAEIECPTEEPAP